MSDASPWYRQFWPWFLIVLMAASVAASVATVVIAYGLGDLEVKEAPIEGVTSLDARKT